MTIEVTETPAPVVTVVGSTVETVLEVAPPAPASVLEIVLPEVSVVEIVATETVLEISSQPQTVLEVASPALTVVEVTAPVIGDLEWVPRVEVLEDRTTVVVIDAADDFPPVGTPVGSVVYQRVT